MREQACVIKQRAYGGFSVVTYSLAAFRYLMTGIVALLLALLLVLLIAEVGAVIGAALEHVHENAPATGNFGGCVTGASAQARGFCGGWELSSASYIPELTLEDQQRCIPV